MGGVLPVLGETCCAVLSLVRNPRAFRLRDSARAFERASYDGLPVTVGIGWLIGVILAFQCAAALTTFGVEIYVSDMLAIALFRELGPIITAVVLAGRTGSAFAAEIGAMKINEELDALTTMGLSPVRFLVLPRLAAAVLAMPILTIAAELAGLFGGALVLSLMNVPTVVFWNHVAASTTVFMILFGLAKSMLFGLLVALLGCAAGISTRLQADGVGQAATTAVVQSIIAIAVSDGALALMCYIWGV